MIRTCSTFAVVAALLAPAAFASEEADAEVVRLRAEMGRLAERSAWAGVERAYVALTESGVEVTYEDHFLGAQAAKGLGDIAAVRARLLAANAVKESQDVMDWLFSIDSSFGEVDLRGPAHGPELAPAKMPFAADQRAAVEFAAREIEENGRYQGYLPSGEYTYGTESFTVLPRVAPVSIDLRKGDKSAGGEAPAPEPVAGGGEVRPAPAGGELGMLTLLAGAGTAYGWVGGGAIAHFGPIGARIAGGYDPVFGLPSGQLGLRAYPMVTQAGPATIAPMAELALAPLIWKEAGKVLYGPALSLGAEASISGLAVDVQVGAGATPDKIRSQTRAGLIVGVGVGYNFL